MAHSYNVYTGNGSTTQFTIGFSYIRREHVKVYVAFVDTAYTYVNNTTVQVATAPGAGVRVEVRRVTPATSPLVDFADGSTLVAADLDTSNLQHLYLEQELDDSLKQTVFVDPATGLLTAANQRITNVADPTSAQDAATKAYTDAADALRLKRDGTQAMTGALPMGGFKVTGLGAGTTSTDAVTKGQFDTGVASAAADAAAAAASAALANDWATKTSGAVAGGEFSAKYHAQASATSAAASNSSKVAAQTAQTAAEAARDQTLAVYDSFDDRYLGTKASDPALDNDGNALIAGALYFNSTSGVMRLYTGAAWVAAYVPGVASSIGFTPYGSISSTNVQLALEEIDNEKVVVTDSVTSTSVVLAATANSAKMAYDRGSLGVTNAAAAQATANAALPKTGGTMTGGITFAAGQTLPGAGTTGTAPILVSGNTTAPVVSADIASQAEAQAGTATNKLMNPLRTAEAIAALGVAASAILYNRRPPLHRGPLFTKTAATTISVTAGAVLNGKLYASATAVTMGTHTNNTDMAIWQHPTTGALVSDASYVTAPAGATGGSIVGGYHYIPSGRPTAFNNGSPTASAEILEYSIWDLTWRPTCPDPRGMTCIDGRFWCDLYLCGSTSYASTTFSAVQSSKIGLTIADNSSPALIPSFYGGDGSTAYSLTGGNNPGSWYNFAEVAHSFGKRFMHSWEFQAAAFGAPEAGSRGSDPGTVIWERQSKWGLAQATGTMYVWAIERVGIYTSGSNTNTGGRGTEYADAPRALILGGSWLGGADSGSRIAIWGNVPSGGNNSIGARFAAEHLVLG